MDEVGYARLMTDKLDLEEGEDAGRDEIRVRCTEALKLQMEALAKAETKARQLRNKTGKVSLNRLMKLVIERYIAAWAADNKTEAPTSPHDKEGIDRAARAINARRTKEGRAKS